MCPITLNDFAELVQTIATAYLEGDGSPLRKLVLRRLSEVGSLESFQAIAKALNVSSDEVRDSQIFAKCASLELMKYLDTNYEISNDDAVRAFCRALQTESLANATWISDEFQITKEDLGHIASRIYRCRNLDLVKWLVEEFQITLDDLGSDSLWHMALSGNTELVRWIASTYKFERDAVLTAFIGACGGGDLDVAKFLVEFYQLTADEIRRDNLALRNCNDELLREWLIDNYYTSN